ncbi:unnamed protein product, partial [Pocillopora meandrina]
SPYYSVCDASNKYEIPENWLITDFINIKDATRLDIEVTYTLLNCPLADVGPFCRTNFSLYSYHTDFKYNPDPKKLNFLKETVITPKILPIPGERTTDTFDGSIITKAKGIYLALLDQGTCLTIRRFVLRYRFCSETVPSKLVRFPRTLAPTNEINLTKQEGECTDPNAIKKNNKTLFAVCLSNGEWNITDNSACLCSNGYELTHGSSDSFTCKVKCSLKSGRIVADKNKCKACCGRACNLTERENLKNSDFYVHLSIIVIVMFFTLRPVVPVINITMVFTNEGCTNGKFNQSSLVTRLKKVMEEAFPGRFTGLRSVQLKSGIRCGRTTVNLALKFNSKTKEQDVIAVLRNAAKDGKLGGFNVSATKRTRSQADFDTGTTEAGTVTLTADSALGITVGVVVGSIAALAVASGIFVFFVRKLGKRNSKNSNGKSKKVVGQTQKTGLEIAEASQSQQYMALDERNRSPSMTDAGQATCPQPGQFVTEYASLYSSPRCWEIPAELVTIEKVVGQGAFSQVARATVIGLQGRPKKTLVVVKTLKDDASESDRKDLMSELRLMKELDAHPHVTELLGCVTKSEPLMVLIEYIPHGDLLGYLRKSRGLNDTYFEDPDIKPQTNLTSEQLMKFAWQVADGMSYLSSIPIIHRDLAARNVFVGAGETCKVTDFGMARDVLDDNIYQIRSKGPIPLKWTAFEALLYGKYSTKSDVWSYGVLLYEIFTIGGSPYPKMDGGQILTSLEAGYRMPRPQHVDNKLYDLMTNCWKHNPNLRPSFEDMRNTLKEMEDHHKGLINLENYDDRLYVNVDDLAE